MSARPITPSQASTGGCVMYLACTFQCATDACHLLYQLTSLHFCAWQACHILHPVTHLYFSQHYSRRGRLELNCLDRQSLHALWWLIWTKFTQKYLYDRSFFSRQIWKIFFAIIFTKIAIVYTRIIKRLCTQGSLRDCVHKYH